jgi:hypothetical protein
MNVCNCGKAQIFGGLLTINRLYLRQLPDLFFLYRVLLYFWEEYMSFYENLYHIYYEGAKEELLQKGCIKLTEDEINATLIENVIFDIALSEKQ